MYKCVFLGCGGRARGHAHAYQQVKRGKLAAICDMNAERLRKFGDDFGVSTRYSDFEEMLDKERPDLLHIVTPPTIRYSLMSVAARHNVPAVIVEKPVALQGEDSREIATLLSASTKFIVNTQLHFHPHNLQLKRDVFEGRIGDIRFVDASARSTPIDQGPHVLELVGSYLRHSQPTKVFGQVSGTGSFGGAQPSPTHAAASVWFANGVRAMVSFGTEGAPMSNPSESVYMHKRIAVFGTKGFTQWTMAGWERSTPDGGHESGEHSYGEQDILGQAGLTEAVFDWLDDPNKPHPTRLEHSLAQFNIIMGLYLSALERKPIALPCEPPDSLLDKLKAALSA